MHKDSVDTFGKYALPYEWCHVQANMPNRQVAIMEIVEETILVGHNCCRIGYEKFVCKMCTTNVNHKQAKKVMISVFWDAQG